MRELKFRTWNWLENRYDKNPCAFFSSDGELIPSINRIIEQYTGLKDKNGKEIYEGDIVDYNSDGDCIGVVEFEAPEFILTKTNNWGTMFLKGECHQTVIGNIHENGELLEDKQ